MLDTQEKRGPELSTSHHLVIRWWGRLPDTPNKSKRIVKVNWDGSGGDPVHKIFNSNLRKYFSHSLLDVRDMEFEWTMFRTFIAV